MNLPEIDVEVEGAVRCEEAVRLRQAGLEEAEVVVEEIAECPSRPPASSRNGGPGSRSGRRPRRDRVRSWNCLRVWPVLNGGSM